MENQQSEPKTSSLAKASLFMGIAAFVIAWIPFVGMITMPLSIIGLIMATISVVFIALKKSSGAGYAISGLVVCGIALYIASAWVYAASEIGEAIEGSDGKSQKVVSSKGDEIKVVEEIWADASEAVQLENIQVKVISTQIGNVPIKTIGGRSESEDNALMIELEIKNVSETSKANYNSWLGGIAKRAGVKDNFDNVYRPIDYGFGNTVAGSVKSDSIYPGKSITDILVFEEPIAKAEYLNLELDGGQVGVKGRFKIRIPNSMVERK